MNDSVISPQRLSQLQQEQEQLRMTMTLVDSHVQEFAAAIQRKRTHAANIGALSSYFPLAEQAHSQLDEVLSGADYRKVMGHVEQYQSQLVQRQHSLAAQIDELRSRLAAQSTPMAGGEL